MVYCILFFLNKLPKSPKKRFLNSHIQKLTILYFNNLIITD